MRSPMRLAWQQLGRERVRFLVAVSGTGFAVVLMLVQLGFRDALYSSSVRFHERLNGDVVLISTQSPYLVQMKSFTRRRLTQALAVPGVESVNGVSVNLCVWKYPRHKILRYLFILGFDPRTPALDIPEVTAQLASLRVPESILVDRASRPEYGPVVRDLADGTLDVELNDRRTRVAGSYELGTSFGIDASVITSDVNFQRLFPDRPPGLIDIGLVRLAPGVDPRAARDRIAAALPEDVLVLTKADYRAREIAYWRVVTPIGFVFGLGVVIGLVVGGIIVSQILFSDVSDHLAEYATLKAMGHGNGYLYRVVLSQALILAAFGYVPGLALASFLFRAASRATLLPMVLTPGLAVTVFVLTFSMCSLAGILALQKLRRADPAEVF